MASWETGEGRSEELGDRRLKGSDYAVWKEGMMELILEIGREWKNRSRKDDDQDSFRATEDQQFQMTLETHNQLTHIHVCIIYTSVWKYTIHSLLEKFAHISMLEIFTVLEIKVKLWILDHH